ncbi:MAG: hypothetical protein E6I48_05155 [Chloroflexi bacterium]|nr:MAG: hypothetical protein E6I48_05155 [Chloroflexota bacterium]
MTAPIKVAVVGGGCASIAAAFELTRREHEGRYQVTVYQIGWRLGGKGASARGPGGRIEEHGLHVWMGWYENAFRLVRECYAELGRDPRTCPIADWREAFAPAPFVGVAEHDGNGRWNVWKSLVPPTDGLPGDPPPDGPRWSMRDYLVRTAVLLRGLFQALQTARDGPSASDGAGAGEPAPEAVLGGIARLLEYGELATLAGLIQGAALLETVMGSLARYPENVVLRFLDSLATNARSLLQARLATEPGLRRIWDVIDVTLATLRGEVRFGIVTDPRGFDAIDEYDCREWLLLNGASERSVDSGFVRALYDLGFSYEDGDPARPRVAAGQAVRGVVRAFFTYRGAFFWKMQAGMGEVVFAPFYEVLRRRGVRFEFFHRLTNVALGDDAESPHVAALEFDVQAEILGGREYEPLIEVGGLPCWPATPDWRQLVEGVRLEQEGWQLESHWERRKARTRTLRVTDDFDLVLLGVGIGAIPEVCREIVARDPRWRAMVDHVKTVATQAFQVWLRADMKELGWPDAPVTLSGFVEPFDTWADMSHLIPRERWPHAPRALAYFCNVLPDADAPATQLRPAYAAEQRARVRANAVHFLNHDVVHLWPRAALAPGRFRWDLLVDSADGTAGSAPERGEARFATQFWTANVNPSDRYTLSLPGSNAYRISPLDRTYDNLTIAGDWTDGGFNAGCVEAAVMSGRLAAHAVAGAPRLEDIVGFDHP